MPDTALAACSPLAGLLRRGRHGARGDVSGVVLQERTGLQIVSLAARKGQDVPLMAAVRAAWGIDLPATPRREGDVRLAFLWSGPSQWLAVSAGWPGDLESALRAQIGGFGSLTDQSDGRVVLRISGPHARDALAKGMTIDLHPRAFKPGDTAATLAAHIGVQIWQLDEEPTYELSVFRSYAGSLCDWMMAASAEYGIEIVDPG